MKGVLLCGGSGSRLKPMTTTTNKHLLPIFDGKINIPMIYHSIQKLIEAGIYNILIITGCDRNSGDIVTQLGNGKQFHPQCDFTYKYQYEPDGIAGALMLAEDFVKDDNFITILGDNIFDFKLSEYFSSHEFRNDNCKILLREVEDPERFGVVKFSHDYRDFDPINVKIINIVEKPKEFISNHIVTGIYKFTTEVFSLKNTLVKSARGEYEITDILKYYMNQKKLVFEVIFNKHFWSDAGEHESYRKVNEYFYKKNQN